MGVSRGVAVLVALMLAGAADARVKVGDQEPKFSITTYDKQKVSAEQLLGDVVIINRWAAWCGPCKAEMPALDAYYRAHAKDGLRIYAIAVDDSASDQWMKALSSALAFPLGKWVNASFDDGGAVPTNFIIDRRGVVRYAKAGAMTSDTLDAVVGPLLAEPAPSATPSVASTH
jgi:cytochrome c biogenesis protein CcmG, thiol:disulfide interchange protein DsbE